MVPTLRVKLEQTGFNEFGYRVTEIYDFPDEEHTRRYGQIHVGYLFMRGDVNSRSLVFKRGAYPEIVLTEHEVIRFIRDYTELEDLFDDMSKYMTWFAEIVAKHDEMVNMVGNEFVMEFRVPDEPSQLDKDMTQKTMSIRDKTVDRLRTVFSGDR